MSSVYDHHDYQHLLAAVRAAPDDDLPRMVLADWLEERGEGERAELIRVQCDPLYTLPCEQVEYPLAGVNGLESYSDIEVRCLCYHDGRTPPQDQWCPQCRARHRVMQIIEASDDENTRHVPHPFNADGWTGFVVKTYDRGFVHTVRGPLGSLIGGACGCPSHDYGESCDVCHGTGSTPGVLRELVKREPVMKFEVTNKDPKFGGTPNFRWTDTSEPNPMYSFRSHPQNQLPHELFRLVTGHMKVPNQSPYIKWFESEASARAALSTAILRLVQPVEVPT